MSQFVFSLYEFADYLRCYFTFFMSLNNSQFREFMFNVDSIVYSTQGLFDTYYFVGLGDSISNALENFGALGTIISWGVDLIYTVLYSLYDYFFFPIYIPSGYTVDNCPFIFAFISGVFTISLVAGMIGLLFKIIKKILNVYLH